MNDSAGISSSTLFTAESKPRLSYKFQRLRERIRQAIEAGELSGKLPGERVLARRFHANAKTLSKALTDLAAEGLLDRSIGRGTFVKGSIPDRRMEGRWLIVCDQAAVDSPVVRLLREANPAAEIATEVSAVRPSFINQFSAVIDMSASTPEAFWRDLMVRNIPLVGLGRHNFPFSTNTVQLDTELAIAAISRELFLAGHSRISVVEPRGSAQLCAAVTKAMARYAPSAAVYPCSADEIIATVENGATGVICDCPESAQIVLDALHHAHIAVPKRVSVAAIGRTDQLHCTGYFATAAEEADAIISLLRDSANRKPLTLWLKGALIDRGTIASTFATPQEPEMRFSGIAV